MPVNLSIKNAPDDVVKRLREQAERNHRSLQGEMLAILEAAVQPKGTLTLREIVEKLSHLDFNMPSEAADMIRADRDRDGR